MLKRLTGQTIKIVKKKPKYIKMIVLEMLKQFNWLRLKQIKHLKVPEKVIHSCQV